jgi:hypothetical protein
MTLNLKAEGKRPTAMIGSNGSYPLPPPLRKCFCDAWSYATHFLHIISSSPNSSYMFSDPCFYIPG